jgi:hypothetical protein
MIELIIIVVLNLTTFNLRKEMIRSEELYPNAVKEGRALPPLLVAHLKSG